MSANLSPPETWAWERIREGQVADFNEHLGETLDPKQPESWGDDRKIGSRFLRTLFFEKPYCDEIPPEGVRIAGAYLPDGQVLPFARVPRQVWLVRCRSEALIDFGGSTISGWLLLKESFLGKPQSLSLNVAQIEGLVDLDSLLAEGEVDLAGAKIGDLLTAIGSIFAQTVKVNNVHAIATSYAIRATSRMPSGS